MNDNLLVSIIIPVYNVEKYLDKAVQSAADQTYRGLEIILVDDGSKDRSGVLCDIWEEKDNRIRVIHKVNGGLSSARNAALDICKGDYIFFLDSDDFLDLEAIEILMRDALESDADIVETTIYDVYNDIIPKEKISRGNKKVLNKIEALKFDIGGGAISSCAKLYKKYIFDTYRFREGKLHEDHFAIVDILSQSNTFVVEPRALYFYVHRKESITTMHFSEKSLGHLEAAEYNYRIIESNYPDAIDAAAFRVDYTTLKLIDHIMMSDDWEKNEYYPKLLENVKRNKRRILKCQYFSGKRKLSYLLLCLNPRHYRALLVKRFRDKGIV